MYICVKFIYMVILINVTNIHLTFEIIRKINYFHNRNINVYVIFFILLMQERGLPEFHADKLLHL